jgi:hypothetical protein
MKKLIITATLAATLALATLHAADAPVLLPELPVAALNPPAKIKGLLGKPLGTRLIIDGTYNIQMMTNARVTSVDGVPLDKPIAINLRTKLPVEEGKAFHLEGYESGAFEGEPGWVAPGAQQNFQFYKFFIVTGAP